MVQSVQETLRRAHVAAPNTRFNLVVDATGVGNPVIDMFRANRGAYQLVPVSITAGGQANLSKNGIYNVPKQDLLSRLTLMVDQRTLEIAPSLPMREALVRELTSFRPNKEPLDGEQDDMILALSLATWRSWKRVL